MSSLAETAVFTWLVVALLAAVVEVSTPHFGFVFAAAGAVAAAAVAYAGYGVTAQIAVFLVVMTVSLLALRSTLLRLLSGPGVPSRTDTVIGRHGVVTHDIDTTVGTGRVNVGGEDWAARSSEPLATGTKVTVVGADGIVLEVRRA